MCNFPCPQLQELKLHGLKLQPDASGGMPGILQHCTALTALCLAYCTIYDTHAASTAVAALQQLRQLSINHNRDQHGRVTFPADQIPTALTQCMCDLHEDVEGLQRLTQLSALVNLEHLVLSSLSSQDGIPGGIPPQLAKLTCLDLQHVADDQLAEQFQHLSGLTALQKLSIHWDHSSTYKEGDDSESDVSDTEWSIPESDLAGIGHLEKLTSLEFQASYALYFSAEWTRLTALQDLTLSECTVHPSALAALPGLRGLYMGDVYVPTDASLHGLMNALSRLTLLTRLFMRSVRLTNVGVPMHQQQAPPPAEAFTALAASTNLEFLWVKFCLNTPPELEIFGPDTSYPFLRTITLERIVADEDELQHWCSCCPALESLAFGLPEHSTPMECAPLLQLSALTSLRVSFACVAAEAAAGLLLVAEQLTGLKSLKISQDHSRPYWSSHGSFEFTPLGLLRPTALTALEYLSVGHVRPWLSLCDKAGPGNPPDVWIQLLRRLLRHKPCRQALLARSAAGAAAPAELLLAQLAATLAEELAAVQPEGQ